MPAPPRTKPLPREGDLTEHPFPRVVLELWREGFSGSLDLARDHVKKRIQWHSGVPISAESNRPSEGLVQQLVDAECIRPVQLERVKTYAETNGVSEGAALLALKVMGPKELLLALREQLRRRLVDCFGWPSGRFSLGKGDAPGEDAQAFRVDPLQILQDGLASHWGADRVLGDLGPQLARYAARGPRFEALAARLRPDPEATALIAAIDPERTFGEVVYASGSLERLAAAWVLVESGALAFADAPPGAEKDEPPAAGRNTGGLDIEIEIRDAGGPGAAHAVEEAHAGELELPSAEAEELREAVLERHARLDELDHYEVLGVAANAPDAAIKRSYFALAKRFHPDSLTRVGLTSLHREANDLFARIAQAYQTLSNPKRRKAYDQSKGSSGPSVDARRVAQAETLFRKGEVLMKVGNFSGALDFLRPCVELWPEEADYRAGLGWALYKAKPSKPEAAREHLEFAAERKPNDPVPLFRLGMVLRKLGETEKGQELLDRSKALEKTAKR